MSGGKVSGEAERYMCGDDEDDNDGIDHRLALMNGDAAHPHKADHHLSMVIILLDEMDQLEYREAAILYELFALPSLPHSRCILVGVSNAMNLTDKALPRLRARGWEPSLVRFTAYTSIQLKQLLCERVQKYDAFELNALELCARKVSAQTGDMRKALRVCTDALQLCVDEARLRYESIEREGCVILDNGDVVLRKYSVEYVARPELSEPAPAAYDVCFLSPRALLDCAEPSPKSSKTQSWKPFELYLSSNK